MVWGGFINEKGSNYIRKLVQFEKVLEFLEKFKEELEPNEKNCISRTIDIIVEHYNKYINKKN